MGDLIDRHTNEKGRFCCTRCGGTNTFLQVGHGTESNGDRETWIRGAVPISTRTRDASYKPFVFLVSERPDGEVTGIAFKYYRTAPSNGDSVKTARPEGGPVLAQSQLLTLVGTLARMGVVSRDDWREFVIAGEAREV